MFLIPLKLATSRRKNWAAGVQEKTLIYSFTEIKINKNKILFFTKYYLFAVFKFSPCMSVSLSEWFKVIRNNSLVQASPSQCNRPRPWWSLLL